MIPLVLAGVIGVIKCVMTLFDNQKVRKKK